MSTVGTVGTDRTVEATRELGSPPGELSGPAVRWLQRNGGQHLERALGAVAESVDALRATFGLPGSDPRRRRWPCDPVPRLIGQSEWSRVEAGLVQRVAALEAFVADLYGRAEVVRDGVVPAWVVGTSTGYLRVLRGAVPPSGIWIHVAGVDLLRDRTGEFVAIEDNLRVPSGAAYAMVNRVAMSRALPELMAQMRPAPVLDYGARLGEALRACSGRSGASVAVLTPGRWNGAYFEHFFLASAMGAGLAEGADLVADGRGVRYRDGPPVEVLYRRVDDPYLDPVALRPDSLVGIPGLLAAWRCGLVVVANAPGTGVADDKGIFPYVPELIRYYLGEAPRLAQARTLRPWVPEEWSEIRGRLPHLVLKPAWSSGGEGIVVGEEVPPSERGPVLSAVASNPRAWVAQEAIDFTAGPVILPGGEVEFRRMDLRPFVVSGPGGRWVLPGGLTRVSGDGGLIVNSSRGGGSKDTWVCGGAVGPERRDRRPAGSG